MQQLSLPPRRAVRRPEYGMFFGNGCAQIFLIPHTLVGLGVLLAALLNLATYFYGQPATATVRGKHTSRSKNTTNYHLEWEYTDPAGALRTGQSQVDQSSFESGRNGQPFAIKRFPVGAWEYAMAAGDHGQMLVFGLGLFALGWNALLALFYALMYGKPWKMKRLVTHGRAAPGRITGKEEVVENKQRVCKLSYEFDGKKGAMTIPLSEGVGVAIGDEVTVLHGSKPSDSILYEYSYYKDSAIR